MPRRRDQKFKASDLKKVGEAVDSWPFHGPTLGEPVFLASGSPALMVVDVSVDRQRVTVAWKENHGVLEMTAARQCFVAVESGVET